LPASAVRSGPDGGFNFAREPVIQASRSRTVGMSTVIICVTRSFTSTNIRQAVRSFRLGRQIAKRRGIQSVQVCNSVLQIDTPMATLLLNGNRADGDG
jgi:hypothetical protein